MLQAVILKDFVHKKKIIFSITPTHSWGADIASSKVHNMTKWNLLQSVLTVSQAVQTHFWNVQGLQSWARSEPGGVWKRWAKGEQETEKESHRGRRVCCREQIRSHLPPWLWGRCWSANLFECILLSRALAFLPLSWVQSWKSWCLLSRRRCRASWRRRVGGHSHPALRWTPWLC